MDDRNSRIVVNIVCPTSGLGLLKDALIIQRALDANNIRNRLLRVDVKRKARGLLEKITDKIAVARDRFLLALGLRRGHISVHLELMLHRHAFVSPVNVLIPNQEWCDLRQLAMLSSVAVVWCKSRLCENIFSQLGAPAAYVGFHSDLPRLPAAALRKREFFTRIGMTRTRGSDQLAALWSRHPEWPTLHMVVSREIRPTQTSPNLHYMDPIKDDDDYFRFAASILFHVYVTEAEGFGHSIVESMTMGAVLLLTKAAPMTEYADSSCVIPIDAHYSGQLKMSPRFSSRDSDIEAAVASALSMSESQLDAIQLNASWVNERLREEFVRRIGEAARRLA